MIHDRLLTQIVLSRAFLMISSNLDARFTSPIASREFYIIRVCTFVVTLLHAITRISFCYVPQRWIKGLADNGNNRHLFCYEVISFCRDLCEMCLFFFSAIDEKLVVRRSNEI